MTEARGNRLETWKGIARYLERSVRTVRRWETHEALPVHRQMHRSQASVYAFTGELDDWLESRRVVPVTKAGAQSSTMQQLFNHQETASVAVLPLDYLGPDRSDAYLADGLTDELISGLSTIRSLRVISRTSVMTLKNIDQDARGIADRLQVGYLLEGTVRRSGDRIRVSVRLIDPANDTRLWAESYDSTLDEIFDIQERIAKETASALQLELTADEKRRISIRPVADIVAWQCVVEARQDALRWREDAIDRAVMKLNTALATEPENTRLMAALGRAHLQYREAGIHLDDAPLDRAEQLVIRIFSIDPEAPEGFELRGWLHYARGHIQHAVADLKRALERQPVTPDPLALLANCYLLAGRVSQARLLVDRLLAIDPLTPLSRCMPGWISVLEGDRKSAIAPYREMFELDPGNPLGRLFYIWVLVLNKHMSGARKVHKAFPASQRPSPPFEVAQLLVHAGEGLNLDELPDPSDTLQALASVTDIYSRLVAHAYAVSGDSPRATYWLTAAMDRGFINWPFITSRDADFSALAGDPRFDELAVRMQQLWQSFET